MSRYVIRHVEGRFDLTQGSVYKVSDLPATAPEGTVYKAWQCDSPYYVKTASGWTPQEKCPTEWRLLSAYQKLPSDPQYRADSWQKKALSTYRTADGLDVFFLRHSEFSNNGGAIRDEYISDRGWSDKCLFRGRGIPEDISPETAEELKYDGEIRGYDHTWCTLDEWNSLYDSEQERILELIKDAYLRQTGDTVNKKLDFLIKHMKDPTSADASEVYAKPVDDDGNEIEYDDYYDSPRYIIDENMPNLFLIAEEIGRITQIAEWNGVYSGDVRIIYYIE